MGNLTLKKKAAKAELLPRNEDDPIGPSLRNIEVLEMYRKIQQDIGVLVNAVPSTVLRKELIDLSTQLCRIKRRWIGNIDELEAEL
jgi:hypothetical protein